MPEKKTTKPKKKDPKDTLTKNEIVLTKELRKFAKEVKSLKELEFIKVLKSPWRMMWLAFWKGMFIGFGTVLGASFLVGLFVFIMSKISLVPYVGDFVQSVIGELDSSGVVKEQIQEEKAVIIDGHSCDIPIDYLPGEVIPTASSA